MYKEEIHFGKLLLKHTFYIRKWYKSLENKRLDFDFWLSLSNIVN